MKTAHNLNFLSPVLSNVVLSLEALTFSIGYKNDWKLTPREFSERIFLADLLYLKDRGTRLTNLTYKMTANGLNIEDAIFEKGLFLKSIKNSPNALISSQEQKVLDAINLGCIKYTRDEWDSTFKQFFYESGNIPFLISHTKYRLSCNANYSVNYTVEEGLKDVFKEVFISLPIINLFDFITI